MDDLQAQTKGLSIADYETFKLGDWKLQCGATLPDAYIAYKTFGDPQSPAIVYPTWYSGGMCQKSTAYAMLTKVYSHIRQCLAHRRR